MTTLTPFRLFQLAKYVFNTYASANPLLVRSRAAARGVVAAFKSREAEGTVGFHVEERRGWDTGQVKEERKEVMKCEKDGEGRGGDGKRSGTVFTSPRSPSNTTTTTTTTSPHPNPRPNPNPSSSHPSEIQRLMSHPLLFHPTFRPPSNVIVLCHGLYGFSTATPFSLFPSLKLHYWAAILKVLREELGCKVMVVGVKGTGSIEERAGQMDGWLKERLPKGTGVNFIAHSMGGLDCRYLISHLKPQSYKPLSLTMVGTPNRGSPFMDWCAANIGVGVPSMTKAAIKAAATGKLPPYSLKSPLLSRVTSEGKSPMQREQQAREDAAEAAERAKSKVREGSGSSSSLLAFPSMFGSTVTDYLLGILDSPAYGNLTTHFLNETFNPSTPDDPSVKYLSVAGRTNKLSVLHPLWFPKLILDAAAERGYAEEEGKSGREYEGNDGLVSVSSAKWGEWLGTVDKAHHWDLRGEGGLLPDLPTIDDKPEGRPDPNAPGGWDWEWRSDSAVKKVKEKVKGKEKEGEAWLNKQAIERMPEMVKKATDSIPNGWDLAQVGQVIDWVGDLMPGSNPDDRAGKRTNGSPGDDGQAGSIGARQMADAAREKAGEDQRQTRRDGQKDKMIRDLANDSNMRQTGEMGKREQKVSENTGHFRLDRFYGGLAAKLSEEGF